MISIKPDIYKVIVDNNTVLTLHLDRKRYFAFGKIDSNANYSHSSSIVLEIDDPCQENVECNSENCILVPTALPPEKAIMLPPLICALQIWDKLALELGEAAIFTAGSSFSRLIGQVAIWRGATPVIQLVTKGEDFPQSKTIELLVIDNPEDSLEILSSRLKNKPGVAIVDLSGRSECIDFIFQVIPKWGRIMFTTKPGSPLTIDFYNNIHRKGVVIHSLYVDQHEAFIQNKKYEFYTQVHHACRILTNKEMFKICAELLTLN